MPLGFGWPCPKGGRNQHARQPLALNLDAVPITTARGSGTTTKARATLAGAAGAADTSCCGCAGPWPTSRCSPSAPVVMIAVIGGRDVVYCHVCQDQAGGSVPTKRSNQQHGGGEWPQGGEHGSAKSHRGEGAVKKSAAPIGPVEADHLKRNRRPTRPVSVLDRRPGCGIAARETATTEPPRRRRRDHHLCRRGSFAGSRHP